MSEARDRQELLAQMAAFCDGVATPEEVARLEERLRDDAAARRAFFNYVDLNVDLHQQQNSQPANELASLLAVAQDDAAARLAGRPPPWFSRPFYFWSFVTVLTLLIWAAMLGWTSRQRAYDPSATAPSTAPVLVASLTEAVDAVWEENAIAWLPGTRLAAGRELRLKSGLAQVTFDDGSIAILEGPCEFVLLSASSARLQKGKVTAKVPSEAVGFTIDAKAARVIDLGTEFGVRVDDAGTAEVAVFEGAVELHMLDAAGRVAPGAPRRIEAGAAVRVTATSVQALPAASGGLGPFVRDMPRQTPQTIGYWRFEENDFLADATGHGFTLRKVGAAKPYAWPRAEGAPPQVIPLTGEVNRSGADMGVRASHFEVPFHPALAPADFTLEAIVERKSLAPPLGYFIASRWQTDGQANQRSWSFGVGGRGDIVGNGVRFEEGELFLGLSSDGAYVNSFYIGSGLVVPADKRHYVAVAYQRPKGQRAGAITFWLKNLTDNGPLQQKTVETHITHFCATAGPLRLGRINADTQRWAGLLDEVRYSNGVLAPEQLLISPVAQPHGSAP